MFLFGVGRSSTIYGICQSPKACNTAGRRNNGSETASVAVFFFPSLLSCQPRRSTRHRSGFPPPEAVFAKCS
ncbi:unnamed protein product [Protopolystoma xenopodis]|uniref:Uncharacterized protein n=1 Tax=Protopolystoma xenopodis TaxID=117903 RepID=A0A3S5A6J4_9PLAT|nr:unnamed protein product [Protopolystoma xenopodis]